MKVILVQNFYYPCFIPITNYYFTEEDFPDKYIDIDGDKFERSTHFDDDRYNNTSISSVFTQEPGYFYYHVQNKDQQVLAEYAVLNVRTRIIFRTKKSDEPKTYTFHYKGYTQTVEF